MVFSTPNVDCVNGQRIIYVLPATFLVLKGHQVGRTAVGDSAPPTLHISAVEFKMNNKKLNTF